VRRRSAARPVVITDAQRSQEDQLRIRTIRYVLMMVVRIVCLVAAVVVVTINPPLLWLWLALCAFGMVVIPWVAVVLANDRLPKEKHRWRRHRRSGPTRPGLEPGSGSTSGPDSVRRFVAGPDG
jgi:hypothetical protein